MGAGANPISFYKPAIFQNLLKALDPDALNRFVWKRIIYLGTSEDFAYASPKEYSLRD